ncbi:MAG: TraR/DksA family transcriptional regulator [Phycisphaeraceae bacterium]|nr:TraR/DksA family transcriptional regulator [Phycisphaeraceae bacterium]MCW5763869.1 TraR/DksA family transcriptional regulator [Phycisphaeraceae bacterium]
MKGQKKAAGKVAGKKAAKKAAKKIAKKAGKKAAKKAVKKASKKAAKKAVKKVARKTTKAPAKTVAGKAPATKAGKAVDAVKKPEAAAKAAPPSAAPVDAKGGRKGITVVDEKTTKKRKPAAVSTARRPEGTQLLGPGSPVRKPLIPSGPSAPPPYDPLKPIADGKKPKSPLNKRDTEKFRQILLTKRSALVGDVSQLEHEALRGRSGDLSKTPQHIAEQGTDSAEQTLSLDLAAADRKLIKEIDDALSRIDEGRFGLCELTGRAIRLERLRELPWARFSIDAARELERRSYTGRWTP